MPPKDPEAPLDRAALKMVEFFRKYRDVYKAAEKAHVPKNQAVKVFNSAAFQDELERQDEAVRTEKARQEVRDAKLTNQLIDQELISVMVLSAEKHGNLKLEAIRLAGVMTGRIQAGNSRALEPQGEPGGRANFYQALVQVQEAAPILPEQPAAPGASTAPIAAAAAAVLPPAMMPTGAPPATPPASTAPPTKAQTPARNPEAPKGAGERSGVIRLG
jgi:hypothetical protein